MRRKFLAGNLKMNGCSSSICELVDAITTRSKNFHDCDVVILPPYLYLNEVSLLLENSHLSLGSQNICQFNNGSYTGEISAEMISELGCDYVLIGHSERRNFFLETNNHILEKVKRALENNLTPILCVGETMEERAAGQTENIIMDQISSTHDYIGISQQEKIIIAYEPIWAIGSGKAASENDVQDVLSSIRRNLETIGDSVTLIYGGSVNPENAQAIFEQADVDGGLIGGASLDEKKFVELARLLQEV